MKKQLLIFTILSINLLALGGVVYFLFFCPTCQATEKGNPTTAVPLSFSFNQEEAKGAPAASETDSIAAPQVGSAAPLFILEDLAGQKVGLNDFRGKKPVLIVFWASTCGWCEKERQDLNKFAKEQRDKVEVLGIAWEPKEVLEKYVEEKKVDFRLLADPKGETQIKYLTFGTPGHFLIDKEGKIAALRPGYASLEDLLELVEVLGVSSQDRNF